MAGTQDQAEHFRAAGAGGVHLPHLAPAAHHHHPVGDREHVLEIVADDDHRDAALADAADQLQGIARLLRAEGGGGFVHHQDLQIRIQDRPGDGHRLALAAGQAVGGRIEVLELDAGILAQDPLRLRPHGAVVEQAEAEAVMHPLAAEEHVGRGRELVDQPEILVEGVDPGAYGIPPAGDLPPHAIDPDLAAVRLVDAGQDLDQGGLAGPVVADDGEHLAVPQVQIDLGDRQQPAERLADPVHGKEGWSVGQQALPRNALRGVHPRGPHDIPCPQGPPRLVGDASGSRHRRQIRIKSGPGRCAGRGRQRRGRRRPPPRIPR